MSDVEPGQVWKVWSVNERWVRAIVMKVEDEAATLRYEGSLEFVMFKMSDLQNTPERFRPTESAGSSP
ncbi:MAG TPA: hypothetical protein VFK06_05880 [Candidatus Angelobacter sp.]|nr:hypothetical protein [Candidatus Angelobacter sp.]